MSNVSIQNPNTRKTWEEEFAETGFWENNQGRRQTKLFAEFFHKHIKLPFEEAFSVLDVGCAIGDALGVWHNKYPHAKLFGCDISQRAVERARKEFGDIATFEQKSFSEIDAQFDAIYCSNVMEHFEDHVAIAEVLLRHCRILYIMTPFAELNNGRLLSSAPVALHVASFFDDTFDMLAGKGVAAVETKIIRCPLAWGLSFKSEALWHVRYLFGWIASPSPPRRQIIYTITRRQP